MLNSFLSYFSEPDPQENESLKRPLTRGSSNYSTFAAKSPPVAKFNPALSHIPPFVHYVESTDSLFGLALRYSVPKESLSQVNKGLTQNNLFAYRKINIPRHLSKAQELMSQIEQQRQELVERLAESSRIPTSEALRLLELSLFDYDAAKERVGKDILIK